MAIFLLLFWSLIIAVIIGGGYLLFTGIKQKSYIKIVLGVPAIILVMFLAYNAGNSPQPEEAFRGAFLIERPENVNDVKTFKRTFMDGHFISFSAPVETFKLIVSKNFDGSQLSKLPEYLNGKKPPNWWPGKFDTNSIVYLRQWDSGGENELSVLAIYEPNIQKAYCIVRYPPPY